jgi:hypothetical protein
MILRWGPPRRIRVDQGSEFEDEFLRICKLYGIQVKVISSHHPQGNGQVERANKDLIDRLTRSLDDDWDLNCRTVAYGINATPSRRTGLSPLEVISGVVPRVSRAVGEFGDIKLKEEDLERLAKENWTRRRGLAVQVSEALRAYENSRQRFKPGDLVWVRNFGRKKFDPRWLGPTRLWNVVRYLLLSRRRMDNSELSTMEMSSLTGCQKSNLRGKRCGRRHFRKVLRIFLASSSVPGFKGTHSMWE